MENVLFLGQIDFVRVDFVGFETELLFQLLRRFEAVLGGR